MSLSTIVMHSEAFQMLKQSPQGTQLWVMNNAELDPLKVADAMRLKSDFSEEGDDAMTALKVEFANNFTQGELQAEDVKLRFIKDGVQFLLTEGMLDSGKEFFFVSETDSRVYFFKFASQTEFQIVFGLVKTLTEDFDMMAAMKVF